MKSELVMSVLIGASVFLSGCGHIHKVDGPIAKSEIPDGVRVGIGGTEVVEGDKVAVMKSICKRVRQGSKGLMVNQCRYEKVGQALVLKVLDHDSAVVQPDSGIVIEDSMRVEKQ